MSKKAVPDNFMESFISGKDPQTPDEHSTEAVRIPDKHRTDNTQTPHNNTLKRYDIRLDPDDYRVLKNLLEDQGITVSAGIRQVLRAFMRKEGLR